MKIMLAPDKNEYNYIIFHGNPRFLFMDKKTQIMTRIGQVESIPL